MKGHCEQKNEPDLDQDKRAQEKLLSSNPDLAELIPWSSFEMIFSDIINLLVEQTNLYAKRDRNKINFSISKEEINFTGFIFLSSYNIRKIARDYWSVDPHLGCSSFRKTMSRNRFEEIKSVFHVADNDFLEQDSRMSKVKLIYDMINEKIAQFGILHVSLSVDESMVPYFGRHSCKQFIKLKPIRFGFKHCVLASSTDMPYNLHIYEGKPADQNEDSLGSRVVKTALAVCEKPEDPALFFDNFFSSYKFLKELGQKSFRETGTMCNDRINHCPLVPISDMKKMERGVHDHRSSPVDKIDIVRWYDNSVVTVGSSAYGSLPITITKWVNLILRTERCRVIGLA